jgi:hypothetical protein
MAQPHQTLGAAIAPASWIFSHKLWLTPAAAGRDDLVQPTAPLHSVPSHTHIDAAHAMLDAILHSSHHGAATTTQNITDNISLHPYPPPPQLKHLTQRPSL